MNYENLNLAFFKLENAINNYFHDLNINTTIEIVLLGSQSILFNYHNIIHQTILSSYEIDIIFLLDEKYNKELQSISNNIDFVYGYGSLLHDEYGFYIDNMTTTGQECNDLKNFQKNWRTRSSVIKKGNIKFTCPDIHDICILKLIANRDKDISYVKTLIQGGLLKKKFLFNSLLDSPNISKVQIKSIKNMINNFYLLPQINIFYNKKNKI